jgi:hypothetical protein
MAALAGAVPKLVIVSEGFQNERALREINARYHYAGAAGDLRVYVRNEATDTSDQR